MRGGEGRHTTAPRYASLEHERERGVGDGCTPFPSPPTEHELSAVLGCATQCVGARVDVFGKPKVGQLQVAVCVNPAQGGGVEGGREGGGEGVESAMRRYA